jgi:hypothetical protein
MATGRGPGGAPATRAVSDMDDVTESALLPARLRVVVLEPDQRHTHAAPPGDDLDCQGDAGGRPASCCDHGDGPD